MFKTVSANTMLNVALKSFSMLHLENLTVRRGAKLLFAGANVKIVPGQKVGVTGANGSGKTSLFALILGKLQADTGECRVPEDWTIGHVEQDAPWEHRAAIDYVLDGDRRLRDVEAQLVAAEQREDGAQMGKLHVEMDVIDGYTAKSRAAQLLDGLGFSSKQFEDSVTTFSGGWRMRLNLGRALMCRSDLLLLDEPTNHLDLDAIIWLEQWLRSYTGTLLMVSHDRDFLDRIVDQVLNIERQVMTLYRGNYTAFEGRRAEQLSQQQSQYVRQQREIRHMQSYIDRFRYKATKARQAQSRLKALQRMTQILPAHVDSPFCFSLLPPEKSPATLIHFKDCAAGYNGSPVLSGVNLRLVPGDRIGLLGANGAGKSTFIRLLAGELEPINGRREAAKDLKTGYFAQRQLEQLQPEHTPIEHLIQAGGGARVQALRDYLGGFGFSNDLVQAPVGSFSGGEKSRLVLALILYRRPNILLLDEPTNHLDIEMRQALAFALQEFSGAMVLVSHDRHLLRVTCDELLLIDRGRVGRYEQSLDDYTRWLIQRKQVSKMSNTDNGTNSVSLPVERKERRRKEAEARKHLQPLNRSIKVAEAELDRLSSEKREIEDELSNQALYEESQKARLKELLLRKATVDRCLQEVEADWLRASEQLELARKGV